METTRPRKATMLRLDAELMERVKLRAKSEHRSINNYIECLILNDINEMPNDKTLAAMLEVRSGILKGSQPVDLTNVDTMLRSAGI